MRLTNGNLVLVSPRTEPWEAEEEAGVWERTHRKRPELPGLQTRARAHTHICVHTQGKTGKVLLTLNTVTVTTRRQSWWRTCFLVPQITTLVCVSQWFRGCSVCLPGVFHWLFHTMLEGEGEKRLIFSSPQSPWVCATNCHCETASVLMEACTWLRVCTSPRANSSSFFYCERLPTHQKFSFYPSHSSLTHGLSEEGDSQ